MRRVRLDDFSEDEPHEPQALVPQPAEQAIVLWQPAPEAEVKKKTAFVGRGRWGSNAEHHLLAARMREGRANKKARVMTEMAEKFEDHVLSLDRQNTRRRGGNAWSRKLSLWAILICLA